MRCLKRLRMSVTTCANTDKQILSSIHIEILRHMNMMRRFGSRFADPSGRTFCALYVVFAIGCVLLSFLQSDGSKGRFIFLQLAVLPQVLLSYRIGADAWLSELPPVACMAVLVLAGFIALYTTGWAVGRVGRALAQGSTSLRARCFPRTAPFAEYNARRSASNLGD